MDCGIRKSVLSMCEQCDQCTYDYTMPSDMLNFFFYNMKDLILIHYEAQIGK